MISQILHRYYEYKDITYKSMAQHDNPLFYDNRLFGDVWAKELKSRELGTPLLI